MTKIKTWNFHCCSFHVRRFSHCPILLNGATRKSTPDMNIKHPYNLLIRIQQSITLENVPCK